MATSTDKQCELQAVPTLIVGLGQTGLSCARFLARCGVPFAVTDSREQPPAIEILRAEQKDIAISVGGFDAALFNWAQRLVVSPGVSLDEPLIIDARQRGIEIVGDIELFARVVKAPIVAITGANGKSTVTLLLAEMVKAAGKQVQVGGNIGTPVLELLADSLQTGKEPDCYVLELSSFQLDTTHSLHAAVAVVLNVSPDHMDRYADLAQYTASKQSIFNVPRNVPRNVSGNVCDEPGVAVINRDDPLVAVMSTFNRQVVSFGLDAPEANNFGRIFYQGQYWLARGDQRLLPVDELRMAGEHNQANALAALALGEALNLPMSNMLSALKTFAGLPHRLQFVAQANGVTWLNDSKGTNVGATLAAIQGLQGPLILIAGGQGKGADFSPLHDAMKDKVRAVILMGVDAGLIEAALANVVPVQRVDNMSAAVAQAHELAQPGDTVLLSPACASFDMFNGFAARGDAFMAAVHDLLAGEVAQ